MARRPPAKPKAATPEAITFPVERAPDFRYAFADNIGIATSAAQRVELSFFSIHNRFDSQVFNKKAEDDNQLTLESGQLKGHVLMVEAACISMSPDVALRTAEALLRHVVKGKLVTAERVAEILEQAADNVS